MIVRYGYYLDIRAHSFPLSYILLICTSWPHQLYCINDTKLQVVKFYPRVDAAHFSVAQTNQVDSIYKYLHFLMLDFLYQKISHAFFADKAAIYFEVLTITRQYNTKATTSRNTPQLWDKTSKLEYCRGLLIFEIVIHYTTGLYSTRRNTYLHLKYI